MAITKTQILVFIVCGIIGRYIGTYIFNKLHGKKKPISSHEYGCIIYVCTCGKKISPK